jgi:chromosome segregation ATPase
MKALKRGSRANRRGSATGVNESVGSDSSGFNAKVLGRTSGGFDETGKRKMKLNLKPLRTPVGAPKPKVGETTKKAPLPNMSLRARLALANRPAIAEAGEHDTKNLMDDQSVASFGYEDSERIRSTLDSARARSSAHNPDVKGTQQQLRSTIGPTSLGHNHASIAAANKAIAAKKGLSTSLVVRSDSKRSTTTESNDMFDTFTQQRRSSLNNTTVADPFGNSDAFSSFTGDTNPKVPAVQRASVIDEDTQSASDTSIMQSDSRGRGKKSKMQKITELLDDKKEWKEKNRALRREIASMEERIDELEAKLEESGDIGTRAEVLRSVAEQDEKLKKTKKELDRVQKESKVLKKQLASKKIELLTMEKERDANMSEVSTLRKELSQALQQVDMLEEEQEGDKEKILKLTKELTHAKEGRDDQSEKSEDDQTMQVQLEVFERKTKKKDRQLEKQRIEVEDQVEHLLRLKAELERAQKLLRDNDDIENRLVELTESNNDLKDQVDTKVRELEDMERFQADTINLQASQLQASERKRKQLLEELKESREEVDDLQQQKTLLVAESTSPASRAIGESEEVVEELRRNLSAGSDELSASKRENKEFQERIAELEKQNSEVQSKLANFGSQSRALNGSLAELRQENSSLGATITELKEKITKEEKGRAKRETSLSSQISSLRSSLDASQNLHQQSENDEKKVVSEMQTKLAETELALEEMKLYNEELEASAEELRETSSDFEQELQRLLEERDAQHAKVEQLHQELEEAGKSAEAIEAMQGRLVEVEDQAFLLNEKNQTLERHLAQVTEENEYLKENVVEVENDAAEAQQAVSALEELMEEYDELQDEAQEMRDKSASLEGEAKRMKSELEEWQGVAERAEEEVKESQEVLALAEETQKDLEALQVEADEARQQSAQVQRKLDEVSTEREVLSLSLQTIEEQLEGTQATVTALEDERSRLLAVESEAMELREYKESAEASIEELHHERDEWMETAKEARAEAKTKQAAISALKESNHEYSDYEVEAAELRAIVDSNETKIDQLIQDRDEYKVASQKAEAELQKTQTELNALEEMVEEFELLQEESEQLRQDKADLESQIEELILEKGEGEKAALQATTDTEEAQALVQANRKELAEKETESSELIHKNTDLVVEVSELQASIDDLKRKAAQAEAYSLEADTTRKDHVEYQERLRESEGVVIELRESNEELIMELENLNNEHEKLMHESDLMKTELTETRHLIHALENTVEDYEVLQEELTSLNADYSRVEQELEERRERTKVSTKTWTGEFSSLFMELSHMTSIFYYVDNRI